MQSEVPHLAHKPKVHEPITSIMLALKKKREAEAKAKADEEAAMATTTEEVVSSAPGTTAPAAKVSLLGIGGKKKKDGTGGATGQKKRSPGEIRIQKGEN
jgi:hypothetical protein